MAVEAGDKPVVASGEDQGVLSPDILDALGLNDDDVAAIPAQEKPAEPDLGAYVENRVAPEEHSVKKLHENGWVQAAGVGGAAAIAVGCLTLILSSSFGIGTDRQEAKQVAEKPKTEAERRGFIESPDRLEQDKSRIQAESAVRDQRYGMQVEQLKQAQQQQVDPGTGETDSNESTKTSASKAPELPPPPPPVVTPPTPVVAEPVPVEAPPVSPQQQWKEVQELWAMHQGLGSFHPGNTQNRNTFGSAAVSVDATVGDSNNSANVRSAEQSDAFPAPPDPFFSGSSNSSNSFATPPSEIVAPSSATTTPTTTNTASAAGSGLLEAQYAFLAGKRYDEPVSSAPAAPRIQIRAGTVWRGELVSPILAIEGDQQMLERPFVVRLAPGEGGDQLESAYLLATINQVARNGFMLLEGKLLVTENGEYEIPAGYIEVRGEGGRLMMAQRIDGGMGLKTLVRMATLATLSGLREAASLYNRTTQETRITDRETVVINRTPPPNYEAASIQGFLSDFVQRANQSINTQMSRDAAREVAAWQIPAGRKVEVFFRRSLSID